MRSVVYILLVAIMAVGIIGFTFDSNDKKLSDDLKKQAEFLTGKNEYEKAIFYYDEILLNDPHNPKILLSKANTLMFLNEFEQAIKIFDKVLEMDPKNLDALLAKASAYAEWGKSKEKYYTVSENTYASVLEYYPNNIQALTGMGYVLSEQLEFEKALFYYNRSLEIDPENTNAQAGKIFALKQMN